MPALDQLGRVRTFGSFPLIEWCDCDPRNVIQLAEVSRWIGAEDHVWAFCKHNYFPCAKLWQQKVREKGSIVDSMIWKLSFTLNCVTNVLNFGFVSVEEVERKWWMESWAFGGFAGDGNVSRNWCRVLNDVWVEMSFEAGKSWSLKVRVNIRLRSMEIETFEACQHLPHASLISSPHFTTSTN